MAAVQVDLNFDRGSAFNSFSLDTKAVIINDNAGNPLAFDDVRIRAFADKGDTLAFTSVLADAEIAVDDAMPSKVLWTPTLLQLNKLSAGERANMFTIETRSASDPWIVRVRGYISVQQHDHKAYESTP